MLSDDGIDIETEAKNTHKGRWNVSGVLGWIKKIIGTTPVSLREGSNERARKYRDFAIYMCANYAKESKEEIAQMFGETVEFVESIGSSSIVEEKYKEEIDAYFEPIIASKKRGERTKSKFLEMLAMEPDSKERHDLADEVFDEFFYGQKFAEFCPKSLIK